MQRNAHPPPLPSHLARCSTCVLLITVVALCGCHPKRRAADADTFAKSYGGPDHDRADAVLQTAEGGYVMVGTLGADDTVFDEFPDPGEGDVWVQKLDAQGRREWAHAYGDIGLYSVTPTDVQRTSDGGFIVAAFFRPLRKGPDVIRLIKLNDKGHLVWAQNYPSARADLSDLGFVQLEGEQPNSVREISGGDLIVAGQSLVATAQGAQRWSALLLRVSASGKIVWERYFDLHNGYDFGNSGEGETALQAVPLEGGGFLVAGNSRASVKLEFDSGTPEDGTLLMQLTDSGDILWSIPSRSGDRFVYDADHELGRRSRRFTAVSRLDPNSFPDATAVAAGFDPTLGSLVLRRYDSRGHAQPELVFGGLGFQGPTAVLGLPDGGIVVAGRVDDHEFYLVRVAANGRLQWNRSYPGQVWALARAVDGTLLCAGTTGRHDFLVVRVNAGTAEEIAPRYSYQSRDSAANPYEYATGVDAISDGATPDGFVVAGIVPGSAGFLSRTGRLLRANADGSPRWYKGVEPKPKAGNLVSGLDRGRSIVQTKDGGYLVAAETWSLSAQYESRIWLLRLEPDGSIRWQRTLPLERVIALRPDKDGFLLGGSHIFPVSSSQSQPSFVWMDGDGNVVRTIVVDVDVDMKGGLTGFRPTPDGGVIAVAFDNPPLLFKLSGVGALEWARSYDATGDAAIHGSAFAFADVELARGGGYVITGSIRAGNQRDILISAVDASGVPVWQYGYGGAENDDGIAIRATRDGGYAILGSTRSFGTKHTCYDPDSPTYQTCQSIWLLKVNQFGRFGSDTQGNGFTGQETFDRVFTTLTGSHGFDLRTTKDDGFIIAGETDGISGNFDAWLLKVGKDGSFGTECPSGLAMRAGSNIFTPPLTLSSTTHTLAIATRTLDDPTPTDIVPLPVSTDTALECANDPSQAPSELVLQVARNGKGNVVSTPAGIDCGATCVAAFARGTAVTLQATAGAGWTFAGWSGDGCADGQVIMDGPRECTATFTSLTGHLNVRLAGTGSGSAVSVPSGIECNTGSNTCGADFLLGTSVHLSAAAAPGSTFVGWRGCDSVVNTVECVVNVPRALINLTATFNGPVQSFLLTVNKVGNGTVVSTPGGIDCGTHCGASFPRATAVVLQATPDPGWTFVGWSGDASCSGGHVTMDAPHSCTATFTAPGVPVTLTTYLGANAANVSWVAARAGNAGWQQLSGTSGVYSFGVPNGGRYSIAVVCPPDGTSLAVQFLELTTSETTAPKALCKDVSRAWNLSGTFSNIPASHCVQWNVWTYGPPWAGCNATYSAPAPTGTYDLVVATTPGRAAPPADGLLIVPNLRIDRDMVLNPDLNSRIALAPHTASISVPPSGSYAMDSAAAYFHTVSGSLVLLGSAGRNASLFNFGGVPAANLGGGIHEFEATAVSPTQRETLSMFFGEPGNPSVDLSVPVPFAPTVTMAATIPYPRPQADFDEVPGASAYTMRYQLGDFTTGSRRWEANALVSAGWFTAVGGRPSYAIPDLSSAPGFDPSWGIQSNGAAISWTVAVHKLSFGTLDNLLQVMARRTDSVPNGFVHRSSSASGSVR